MFKFLILVGLTCVLVTEASVRSSFFRWYQDDENEKTLEPECDPSCGKGKCCTAALPLDRYACILKREKGDRKCLKGIVQCYSCNRFSNYCCVKTIRKGFCSTASKKRCFNPARFAISSKCCPEGKVCKSKSDSSFLGSCVPKS